MVIMGFNKTFSDRRKLFGFGLGFFVCVEGGGLVLKQNLTRCPQSVI